MAKLCDNNVSDRGMKYVQQAVDEVYRSRK